MVAPSLCMTRDSLVYDMGVPFLYLVTASTIQAGNLRRAKAFRGGIQRPSTDPLLQAHTLRDMLPSRVSPVAKETIQHRYADAVGRRHRESLQV